MLIILTEIKQRVLFPVDDPPSFFYEFFHCWSRCSRPNMHSFYHSVPFLVANLHSGSTRSRFEFPYIGHDSIVAYWSK